MDAGPNNDNACGEGGDGDGELEPGVVSRTIRKLVTSIHHRTTSLSLFQSATLQPDACPDIRLARKYSILVCQHKSF